MIGDRPVIRQDRSNGRTTAFEAVYPGSPRHSTWRPVGWPGESWPRMYYAYILHLDNGDLYKGSCNDLKRRLVEHESGQVESTKNFRPLKLIHYEAYSLKSDAQRREKYLKTTEGRRFLNQQIKDLLESYKK